MNGRVFVQSCALQVVAHWPNLDLANRAAHALAREFKGNAFYVGTVGSDPRTHSRWMWDEDWNDAIKFACND